MFIGEEIIDFKISERKTNQGDSWKDKSCAGETEVSAQVGIRGQGHLGILHEVGGRKLQQKLGSWEMKSGQGG